MKPAVNALIFEYYSYIFVCTDDILIINKIPQKFMHMLKESHRIKPDSIQKPKKYLGADVSRVYHPDGSHAWILSSKTCVKEYVKNVKSKMAEDRFE